MLGEKTSHLSGGKDDDVPQSQLDKAVPWFKKWYPNWVKERPSGSPGRSAARCHVVAKLLVALLRN